MHAVHAPSRQSLTRKELFNHATRPFCVVIRVRHETQNGHSDVRSEERRGKALTAPVGARKPNMNLKSSLTSMWHWNIVRMLSLSGSNCAVCRTCRNTIGHDNRIRIRIYPTY